MSRKRRGVDEVPGFVDQTGIEDPTEERRIVASNEVEDPTEERRIEASMPIEEGDRPRAPTPKKIPDYDARAKKLRRLVAVAHVRVRRDPKSALVEGIDYVVEPTRTGMPRVRPISAAAVRACVEAGVLRS